MGGAVLETAGKNLRGPTQDLYYEEGSGRLRGFERQNSSRRPTGESKISKPAQKTNLAFVLCVGALRKPLLARQQASWSQFS